MRDRLSGAVLFLALSLIGAPALVAHAQDATKADDAVARIRDEGMNHSQVMQTLSYLSDVIGPRLTGSPALRRANEWTKDRMASWGLQNAHLEAWGPFGRGWTLQRFSAQVVSPQDIPLISYPKAWSPGLKRPLTAEVVYVDAKTDEELQKYHGKLKGVIVLNGAPRDVVAHFDPLGVRYTDAQLADMEAATGGARPRPQRPPGQGGGRQGTPEQRAQFQSQFQMAGKKAKFFQDEGVALLLEPSPRGDGGTIFVQSASVPSAGGGPRAGGRGAARAGSATTAAAGPQTGGGAQTAAVTQQPPAQRPAGAAQPAAGAAQPGAAPARRVSPWDVDAPKIIPQVVVADEQYNRMVRMLAQGETLKMAVELQVEFTDKDRMAYNTIAEIPGTDLKDQVVMLGAHMDSWHSGTGATDNGAGCAVCMEAVRILEALKLQPRRTVRVGLWTGEEEGLFGSRAYVASHFGSRGDAGRGAVFGLGAQDTAPPKLTLKPEFEKLSAYYNLDNGTGKIRGIYLQGNAGARSIFKEWLTPFSDLGAGTVTISNTGGTDHQSFDAIGLPGFQFIQDSVEYETRTHHSNQDVFDRIQADDLKQAAVIMATFVYKTAMRDEMIPRKTAAN